MMNHGAISLKKTIMIGSSFKLKNFECHLTQNVQKTLLEWNKHALTLFSRKSDTQCQKEEKVTRTTSIHSSLKSTRLELTLKPTLPQVTSKLKLQDFSLMNGPQLPLNNSSNGVRELLEQSGTTWMKKELVIPMEMPMAGPFKTFFRSTTLENSEILNFLK